MKTENDDSIELLKECDAGTKMAISSLDEVLETLRLKRGCRISGKTF